jgi:hypothetical protein
MQPFLVLHSYDFVGDYPNQVYGMLDNMNKYTVLAEHAHEAVAKVKQQYGYSGTFFVIQGITL